MIRIVWAVHLVYFSALWTNNHRPAQIKPLYHLPHTRNFRPSQIMSDIGSHKMVLHSKIINRQMTAAVSVQVGFSPSS